MSVHLKLVSESLRKKFVTLHPSLIAKYEIDILLSDIDESDPQAKLFQSEDTLFFGDYDSELSTVLVCCLIQETEDRRYFARPQVDDPVGNDTGPCKYGQYFTDLDEAIRVVGEWAFSPPGNLPIEYDHPVSRLQN